MKRLTEIGLRTNTDKATYHLFTECYDDIFSKYKSPRILEIGVATFSSIAMYLEYFDNPYVVGMDVEDKAHFVNERWKFIQGNQADIQDLQRCVEGEDLFDIILDDGGHSMKQQQVSFGFLIDYVKPGGYYILEDLHTSMRSDYIEPDCKYTSLQMLDRIQKGEEHFSNYIPAEKQKDILRKIKSIEIVAKNPADYYDSITSIIEINNF